MPALKEICLIIDIEGFFVDRKFHPRELGYFSLTKDGNESIRFNLNRISSTMSPKDWKTALFCKFNIHGLSVRLRPNEKDWFYESALESIIRRLHNEHKTGDRQFIAYKGGCIEENYLSQLGLPHVNLEVFDCPKFVNLPAPDVEDCGFHEKFPRVHCPKVECAAFGAWVKQNASFNVTRSLSLCTLGLVSGISRPPRLHTHMENDNCSFQ